jgi:predicted nuclease of predicted toxin-antitoxin system
MASFKLDENLPPNLRDRLQQDGYEVATVADQHLGGAGDQTIAEACRAERRCLITADQGFAQILAYPPEEYAGIIVLRHPRPNLDRLAALVELVAVALRREAVAGRLWIVEPGRIRIHERS